MPEEPSHNGTPAGVLPTRSVSSYYSVLILLDFDIIKDPENAEVSEIVELSWVVYDGENRRVTSSTTRLIKPQNLEISDEQLTTMNVERDAFDEADKTLFDAIKAFDSSYFESCQASRKPVIIVIYGIEKLRKHFVTDIEKKDITLFPHFENVIDIVHLIKEKYPEVSEEDLASVRTVASKIGLDPIGSRDSAIDCCQTMAAIISQLFLLGIQIKKDHAIPIFQEKAPSAVAESQPASTTAILRLRGLPWEITDDQLTQFISPVAVVDSKNIHIVYGFDGRTNGEAYIVMPEMESRDAAIRDLHGKSIGKRWVEVFKATEEEFNQYLANRKVLSGGCTAIGECVLRLRGLPWSCNEYEIVKFFKDGGFPVTVDEVVMGYAGDNRLNGEAWVLMSSPEKAEKARTQLHRKEIGRRYIEVFPSTQEEMQMAKKYRTGQPSTVPIRSMHQYQVAPGVAHGFSVVRLRGLPFNANESNIVRFFNGFHMLAILPGTAPINGRPSGEAYVQFADEHEAWRAYESRNRQIMEKRYIELFPATKQEMEYAANGGDPRAFRQRNGRPY